MFSIKPNREKSYRPFLKIWARGERIECFGIGVLCLLKYSRLLFRIIKIKFKAASICDHSAVFVNIFRIAFPYNTPTLSCWIHILRKLLKGRGNGGYKHLLNNSSFCDEVITDIRNLHQCLSYSQFKKYASLVKLA